MKAVLFTEFGGQLSLQEVQDPVVPEDGVVIQVKANGICRSDWHGWQGHDSDVRLPHVPGHELAGIVVEVGKAVKNWHEGDRVTVPFSCGCGACEQCVSGNQQICDNYFQPGFTAWGSFAEFVAIRYADVNLVRLPDDMYFTEAACLGCRFITSFRAVVHQGRVRGGEWVAVHGCGGVGLSAIMIANAFGANVIAIDIDDAKLDFARSVGATHTVNARSESSVVEAVMELSKGGAHISLDALGSAETCRNSILNLRKRGRHIQVGLMVADDSTPRIPMGPVIAKELEVYGSHGMQAHEYGPMLSMITSGKLEPARLISKSVTLNESIAELEGMSTFQGLGVSIITHFT
jgi:alcohol dehydrogenase